MRFQGLNILSIAVLASVVGPGLGKEHGRLSHNIEIPKGFLLY